MRQHNPEDIRVNLKVLPQVMEVKLLAMGHEIRVVVATFLTVGVRSPAFALHLSANILQLLPVVAPDIRRIDHCRLHFDVVIISEWKGGTGEEQEGYY